MLSDPFVAFVRTIGCTGCDARARCSPFGPSEGVISPRLPGGSGTVSGPLPLARSSSVMNRSPGGPSPERGGQSRCGSNGSLMSIWACCPPTRCRLTTGRTGRPASASTRMCSSRSPRRRRARARLLRGVPDPRRLPGLGAQERRALRRVGRAHRAAAAPHPPARSPEPAPPRCGARVGAESTTEGDA